RGLGFAPRGAAALPPFPAVFLVPGWPTFGARPSAVARRRSFSCFHAVRSGSVSSPEYALCQGRSSAGSVRPRPASDCPFLPPQPRGAPFFELVRRPLRGELPGIGSLRQALAGRSDPSAGSRRPSWTRRGVFDCDARPLELVAHRVGGGPVLARACRLPLLE